jgi:aspartyl-tRNA synthetase
MTNKYKTNNCGDLNIKNINQEVTISGWLNSKRDHGGVLFLDLRDSSETIQCVIDSDPSHKFNLEFNDKINKEAADLIHIKCQGEDAKMVQVKDGKADNYNFVAISKIRLESVLTITGTIIKRDPEAINDKLATGEIEVKISKIKIESFSKQIPFQINDSNDNYPEDLRLKYRFLDLRRKKIANNIKLRSQVISYIRSEMTKDGFLEIQTPILTSSSPEGARDYLVPSRVNPGKFYALPQAPQQFKQLLMVSGFNKYFQIAPCFRDEDLRADRSPEFYQLDLEMSFVEQEDVFLAVEPLLRNIFSKFGNKVIKDESFEKITYYDAMLKYGSDKPDLRNPIIISKATEIFENSGFGIFTKAIANGSVIRAIPAPKCSLKARSFFDKTIEFAISNGAGGLAYIIFDEEGKAKGPIAKFLSEEKLQLLKQTANLNAGDAVFFSCGNELEAAKIAGLVRTKLAEDLNLIDQSIYKFCWIIDFPMYEINSQTGKIDFSHNPFSMPQGEMQSLENEDPLKIKAYQYDIVCNGVELSSGAIRNHKPEIMYKAFEIAGYDKEDVEKEFGTMLNAFKYGAPPHGGIAPGIDRIIMLLADEPNIREVIAFPMNGKAQDLLMDAPTKINSKNLKELYIKTTYEENKEV